jgi:rare lipoprotein A (peptidoglycan hydrolase)
VTIPKWRRWLPLAVLAGVGLSGVVQAQTQTTATWYHPSLHGNVMRYGGVYDRHDPTIAASNAYPAGTPLRVTRVGTDRSISVTVRDTGAPSLTLDLSEAGFMQLGTLAEGRIPVTVEVLR